MSFVLSLVLAASSVDALATEVGGEVRKAGLAAPVGVYVEGSPAPLSRALASVVMARLAEHALAPVPVVARDATEAERLARERQLGSLLRLTVALEAPKLVVRGDGLSTWVNFWSGQTPTRTGPAIAIAASVDADVQALTLAGSSGPSRPLSLSLGVLARLPDDPTALTIADVDGDHHAEVIVLRDDALWTFTAEGSARGPIALSAPLSTRPTREPFGWLAFEQGRLVAWSSRRQRPEAFTWSKEGWRSQGLVDALHVGSLQLTPRPGLPDFARETSWSGKPVVFPEPVTQLSLFGAVALATSASGKAWIARGQAPQVSVSGVGCGSTLADLDGDGTPEVIITTTRALGDADEVRVLSLGAFESTAARNGTASEATSSWQKKLEGRALLAASGDLDGDGVDEVVLGTWSSTGGTLTVLRNAP